MYMNTHVELYTHKNYMVACEDKQYSTWRVNIDQMKALNNINNMCSLLYISLNTNYFYLS